MISLFLAASVLLSWVPVKGADYYQLYVGQSSMRGGAAAARVYKTTDSKYTVPSLNPGTKYYFYVKTYCPYGTVLGSSNEVTFTP